jgi:hypothetical protein
VVQQDAREDRIEDMSAPNWRAEELRDMGGSFLSEWHIANTFFVSDAEPEDMLIIQGNFLDSPYYFWVCMHTKIAALGDLWLRAEYGEDTNTTLDGTPRVRARWMFGGQCMRWSKTIEEMGMEDGSVFKIVR